MAETAERAEKLSKLLQHAVLALGVIAGAAALWAIVFAALDPEFLRDTLKTRFGANPASAPGAGVLVAGFWRNCQNRRARPDDGPARAQRRPALWRDSRDHGAGGPAPVADRQHWRPAGPALCVGGAGDPAFACRSPVCGAGHAWSRAGARRRHSRRQQADRLMPIIVNLDVMLAKRKMRSKELAEKIGITEQNLSLLKSGKVRGVRFETLAAICAALECQPGDLLEWRED
jgi:putative transcriptional regulator